MQVINSPGWADKKREGHKRKELIPCSCENTLSPLSPRVRTRTHMERYREAGAAARELMSILHVCSNDDFHLWAWYCYHHDIGVIMERAHRCASEHRQNELRNPVTAFQKWLTDSYGEGGVK